MLRVYRLNTGSCGGCDLEIDALIDSDDTISWANTPFEADALLLTGPIPAAIRPALLALLHAVGETLPL
ncbi:MAG TPA: NADH:ubiquinone oxidoreductase, partial [Roseiflexaceae bacterium]|nr:NADH:ubiquinone oxidoreductase [Roseiflexaceae bacterium]